MWYNEKFVYYSNSPGFYEIYFLGKKLFWRYMMYNWDVKIPGKEKKTIIVKNTNLVWCLLDCLFFLSKLLLLLLPWLLSPPPLVPTLPSTTGSTGGIARNFTHRFMHRCPIISLPVTLRTTNAESEKIATLEVKYRTSRTNFTHRIA